MVVIIVCIIVLSLVCIVRWIDDTNEEITPSDDSVTFYDLVTDFDTTKFKFASYEPGDNVTVKDVVSKIEIHENMSVDHNGKQYEYSANIWLESMKKLDEYYKQPTLSLVGDQNRTTMESNFRVGDEIIVYFSVKNTKSELNVSNPKGHDGLSRSVSDGFRVLNISFILNNTLSEVEACEIKVGLLAGSPETSIYDTCLEISWGNNNKKMGKSGETTLFHCNNTAFYQETMVLIEVENVPGIYIWNTIFDHIEKPESPKVDSFRYEILRDIEEYSLSEGIMTSGDVIMIIFNFSQFHEPPPNYALDSGSVIQIEIIPNHGVPTWEEINLPEVFPEDKKLVQC